MVAKLRTLTGCLPCTPLSAPSARWWSCANSSRSTASKEMRWGEASLRRMSTQWDYVPVANGGTCRWASSAPLQNYHFQASCDGWIRTASRPTLHFTATVEFCKAISRHFWRPRLSSRWLLFNLFPSFSIPPSCGWQVDRGPLLPVLPVLGLTFPSQCRCCLCHNRPF